MFFVFITQQLNCPSNTPLTVVLTLKNCLIMQSFYCISKAVNDKKRLIPSAGLEPPTLCSHFSALAILAILLLIWDNQIFKYVHDNIIVIWVNKNKLVIFKISAHFVLVIYAAFICYFSSFLKRKIKVE